MNNNKKRMPSRWFTISIRTLLALLTVVAILVAMVAQRDNSRRSAAEKIKQYGGVVSWRERGPKWLTKLVGRDLFAKPVEIVFVNKPLPDDALASLSGLEEAEQLVIAQNNTFTGHGLRHLRNFKNLRYINLYNVPVTDDGLENLPRLESLEKLDILATKITDKSFQVVGHLNYLSELQLGSEFLDGKKTGQLKQQLPNTKINLSQQPFQF